MTHASLHFLLTCPILVSLKELSKNYYFGFHCKVPKDEIRNIWNDLQGCQTGGINLPVYYKVCMIA